MSLKPIVVLCGALLAWACSGGDRATGNNDRPDPDSVAAPNPSLHLGYVKNDGSQQTAIAGTELRLPFIVQVLNRNVPAPGVFVTWSTETGEGMSPALAKSDANGLSASRFRTNTRAGLQTAMATLNNESIIFYIRVMPDVASRALIDAGDGDSAGTGGYVTLRVKALDQYGNGVPDVPVDWQILSGDISLVVEPEPTVSSGQAVMFLQFGTAPGPATIQATVNGFPPLTFNVKSY